MIGILIILLILLSCYFLILIIKPQGLPETILAWFVLFTSHVILSGYLFLWFNGLNNLWCWAVIPFFLFICSTAAAICLRGKEIFFSHAGSTDIKQALNSLKNEKWFAGGVLGVLFFTVLFTGLLNFLLVLFSSPGDWDSLAYHIARAAYYLQNDSLKYFSSNYWAQSVHPKNSAILLIFTYLVSGREENMMQLVQFISYWVSAAGIYGITRKSGMNIPQSLFSALISAILVNWLMEAKTTQNDMVLTACLSSSVYFLLAFRRSRRMHHALLSAVSSSIALGMKLSYLLPFILILLMAAYFIFSESPYLRKKMTLLLASSYAAAFILFTLPSGYAENYMLFGNPSGPAKLVSGEHTFAGKPASYVVSAGVKNIFRYAFDFLSLDGMYPNDFTKSAQRQLRLFPVRIMNLAENKTGFNITAADGVRAQFQFLYRTPSAHEANSYWGILGFGLVWIAAAGALLRKKTHEELRLLSLMAFLFFLLQAFAGPYDPWRGRYFIACAVFAAPAVSLLLSTENFLLKIYLAAAILFGSVSAFSAVFYRENLNLLPVHKNGSIESSILSKDRTEQITEGTSVFGISLRKFDEIVPQKSTVAVCLTANQPEYILFGRNYTRKLIPINLFDRGVQPVPKDADYLLYDSTYKHFSAEDLSLGNGWNLRRLREF